MTKRVRKKLIKKAARRMMRKMRDFDRRYDERMLRPRSNVCGGGINDLIQTPAQEDNK